MKRKAIKTLIQWINSGDRKPLILRGARQVGKTWTARELARETGKKLIELNFERNPEHKSFFTTNDPNQTVKEIEFQFKKKIDLKSSLLFLDEIQAAPEVLAKLRWFYEELPDLPIICAGSLLDFALEKYSYSMPVGRISYFYLEPLSFEEFLLANNAELLYDELNRISYSELLTGTAITPSMHSMLNQYVKSYMIIGGLPRAVSCWIETGSYISAEEEHLSLLATYKDDFNKYHGRLDTSILERVLEAIPKMIGEKFKYSNVTHAADSSTIKNALRLITTARIAHKTRACSASGLPLGATANDKFFKVFFLDVGLISTGLGLSLENISSLEKLSLVNKGGLAEQLTAQMLRTTTPYYVDDKLHYWVREKSSSAAEIDFIIQSTTNIVPVEVKAGKTGSLKSLHNFMAQKELDFALRLNASPPSIVDVSCKASNGDMANYKLLSLPFYLGEQIQRLLGEYFYLTN